MTPSAPLPWPEIAVITVSFGSETVLPGFLESIAETGDGRVVRIVVDNRPDGTSMIADISARHGAQYLRADRNLGYGGAVNAAAAGLPSSVRWILVSNPDVVLHPGAIERLVATGESDERIGAVGPALLTADGHTYPSARSVPSLRTGVGHALFANLWTDNPWTRAYRRDADTASTAREAGWLSGACVLVRRTVFDMLGGFDEGYFMYFEDVDLGYRIGLAGFLNIYDPSAVAVHVGAHSTGSESARMVAAHHMSARRFLAKKYRGWHLWPVRFALRLGLAARSAVVTRRLDRR